jgi:integrase
MWFQENPMQVELTPEAIKNAQPGDELWDRGDKSSVTGLHMRVVSASRKSFYLKYRTAEGQQRRYKLGDVGILNIAQARAKARADLAQVRLGKDPKGRISEFRGEPTVAEVFELCFEEHWNKDGKATKKSGWAYRVQGYYRNHIGPEFGKRRLSTITPIQLENFLENRADRQIAANRSLEVLSKLFTFAQKKGFIRQGINPCELVDRFTERKRKRYASVEEIARLFDELDKERMASPRGVAIIKCLLLTGSRPSALERARRENLRIEIRDGRRYGILTQAGKSTEETGEDEDVIFPPEAMEILDSLPEQEDGSLFGVQVSQKIWERVRERAGCKTLWARDLRRTFGTIGINKSDVPKALVGKLLNHKDSNTTDIYALLMHDNRLEAAGKVAKTIQSLRKVKSLR